jgi:hypothetical protein
VVIEPIKAWAKIGSSASHRAMVDWLAGFVRLHPLHPRIEVQDMYTLRPLAFENRTHLGLKEFELPRIHRAGAVDGDPHRRESLVLLAIELAAELVYGETYPLLEAKGHTR